MKMGETIRSARNYLGLTQKELAHLVGVAEVTIRQYEADRREPSYSTYLRLEEALRTCLVVHPPEAKELEEEAIKFVEERAREVEGKEDELFGSAYLPEVELTYADPISVLPTKNGKPSEAQIHLISAYNRLNEEGKRIAIERIEELTEVPKYRRTEPPEGEEPPEDEE